MSLTAVGRLIRSVHTVVVPVTHPHPWDAALRDGALELIGGTGHLGCKKTNGKRRRKRIQKNCNTAPAKKELCGTALRSVHRWMDDIPQGSTTAFIECKS